MLLLPFLMMASPAPRVVAVPGPSAPVAVSRSCLPASVLRGATVVALGTYAAHGEAEAFKLAGSPYSVHRMPVTGRGQDPVVLVVAAYEPTLWDLSAIKSRVRAVVASGYSPQAVTGLDAATPVRFSSAIGTFRGSDTCGKVRYAYGATDTIAAMADDIRGAIGIGPRAFYGGYSIDGLDIDGPGVAQTERPDLAGVRTAVPLITEDDPASGAQMKSFPSPEEIAARTHLRIVEWNPAGRIVRDIGGPKISPLSERPGPAAAYERDVRRRTSDGLRWLLWIAIGAFALWMWRRSTARNGPTPLPRQADGRPRTAPDRPTFFEKQVGELTALAAIANSEPLVVALHRYGKEVQVLPRTRFDPDLADEITAIVERHFDHAVARYRAVRASLDGAEGERADDTLRHAVDRLTERLAELRGRQHARDIAGVDEAARFIETRHPA